ncbi:unnamed protein product [Parnassius mnemosyne]|uniref:Spaetzle domain-containing protein n=1 Tax=Parnassius mnemosyne TaxID=213953 RepID=A0AAV1LWC4_9NEOP
MSILCILIVIFISQATTHNVDVTDAAATQLGEKDMQPIIFPGPIEGDDLKYGTDDVPDECKDKTYCTIKPPDYPEEIFNKMFKGLKPVSQPSLVLDSILSNRQGDPDERDDCESEVKYEPLYKVRPKRDEPWRIAVQAPEENYVQRVRLETCTNPDAPCFNIFPQIPDITTFCKQKYNKWEVLVAKGENETEKIEVELPVCCSCHYKSAPIETRFGITNNITPIKKP